MAIKYNPKNLTQVKQFDFSVSSWQGLNNIKGAELPGEFVSMKNMSSDNIPFSSPRTSREVIKSGLVNPQNLFNAGGKLAYIANGELYYDQGVFTDVGTVGNTTAIVDFNGNIVMYPSNFYYDYVNNTFSQMTITTLTKSLGSYDGVTGVYSSSANTIDYMQGVVWDTDASTIAFTETVNVSAGETIRVSSNATVINARPDGSDYYYYTKVFVVAFDASNKVITNYTSTTGYKYAMFDVGAPISIVGAVKYKIMLGYSKKYRLDNNYINDANIRDYDYTRTDFSAWVTRSTYPTLGIPTIDYASQLNNRIFAVEGSNIYASAQGKFDDWTTFNDLDGNPDPLGAFATDVGSAGHFNGVVAYKGRIVCTKPDNVYEIYGDRPPYTVSEIAKTGCIDGKSICEVNSILYWLGRQGIYAYTGGQPRIISDKLNLTFSQGVAGTDGRKYYCSLYSDKWQLFVFDTFTNLWHIEDCLEVKDFTYFEGSLYALTSTGDILKFNSGAERVEWEFETQDYTFNTQAVKNIQKLYIRAEMQPYTEMDIYLRSNNGGYERVANYSANETSMFDFKVKVKKCDSFSLKFVGRGDIRILDIHGKVTVGTSKHRCGDNLHTFRG